MKVSVLRTSDSERVVTPLELFFDLVYVFAIGQLSRHLFAHVDLRVGAETVVMTLAVIYAWYMTAWGLNWLEPDRAPVKVLIVGLMFASMLMSAGIADAFGGRPWVFVSGYLLLQVGRAAFMILALRGRALSEHFVNDLVWELAAGSLFVAGAVTGPDARLVLWALAVLVAQVGAWALHWLPGRGRRVDLAHTEIAAEHLFERFRLFFLIALGETVVTTGTAFANRPFELSRLLALAISFAGSVALWWCYFERAERIGVEAAESADDAGDIGWSGTWALTIMVIGLIGIAVGDELAIAHPGAGPTLGFVIITFGGVALFLLSQLFFLARTVGRWPRSRLLGLAAVAVLAAVTAPLSLTAAIAAVAVVLAVIAITDAAPEAERTQAHS